MSNAQKIGSIKNMQRSAREKSRNAAARPERIKRARKHHLKNARRSCGLKFAAQLEKYYATTPVVGTKAGKRRSA